MTEVEYLRQQANRADRLAQNMLDAVTVTRLIEASRHYRSEAERLERSAIAGSAPAQHH